MKKLLWIGLAFFVVLVGCDLVSRDYYRAEDDFPENSKGLLVLVLDGSAIPTKTIAPLGLTMDIDYYNIIGYRASAEEFNEIVSVSDLVSGVHTQNGLTPDTTWTVDVIAYNINDIRIGSGAMAAEFTVYVNIITPINISVLPDTGNSSLSLTLPWPADTVVNPFIDARLTKAVDGSFQDIDSDLTPGFDVTTIPNQGSYTDPALSAGYYTLEIKLFGEDTNSVLQQLWGEAVSIRIVDALPAQPTDYVWPEINATGGVAVTLDPDLKNPLGIYFTTVPTTPVFPLALSDSLEVIANFTVSPPGTSSFVYTWYLDGVFEKQTGTAATPTTAVTDSHSPALTSGSHNLSVVITEYTGAVIDSVSSETYHYTVQ